MTEDDRRDTLPVDLCSQNQLPESQFPSLGETLRDRVTGVARPVDVDETQSFSEAELKEMMAAERERRAIAHEVVELMAPIFRRFERALDRVYSKLEDVENAQANQRQGLEMLCARCNERHGNGADRPGEPMGMT